MIPKIISTLILFVLANTSFADVSNNPMILPEVENAVLAEDWDRVINLLPDVDPNTPSAVLRLIKGHACLAVNENNKATCLFLSVQEEYSLKEWKSWTESFVANNPDKAISWMFKGDSLARNHQWNEAIAVFDKALGFAPEHPLIVNARGVVHASRGDHRQARVDFDNALGFSESRLADAHANIGALALKRMDGAEGGRQAFDEAINLSADFALALHGRGCLMNILSDEDGAIKDLEASIKHLPCVAVEKLMVANSLRYDAYRRGMTGREFLASLSSDNEAGTTFDAKVTEAQNRVEGAWNNYKPMAGIPGGQWRFNRYMEAYGQYSKLDPAGAQKWLQNTVQPEISTNPRIAKGHADGFLKMYRTNERGGLSDHVQATTRILGTTVSAALGAKLAVGTAGAATIWGAGVAAGGRATSEQIARSMASSSAEHMKVLTQYPMKQINPAGGIDTDLTGIKWDDGEWPFAGYFSLAYFNNYNDLPVNEILETLALQGDNQSKSNNH